VDKVENLLTLSQAADELGLKPATLRSQIRFGAVAGTKIGPIWTVSRKEVERYRENHLGKYGVRPSAKAER
jgi:hypothetical protein